MPFLGRGSDIEEAKECRKSEENNLQKALKIDTDRERDRYRRSRTHKRAGLAQEEEEDNMKNEINELIYSKCIRREKRSQDDR